MLTEKLEQLVGLFWDIGLEIGHSVRTIEECLNEAAGDLTVKTALVEARLIIGNEKLFSKFTTEFRAILNPQEFFHAKRMEQDERYLRLQESPYSRSLINMYMCIRDSDTGLSGGDSGGPGRGSDARTHLPQG